MVRYVSDLGFRVKNELEMGNRSCRETTAEVQTRNRPGWWLYGLRGTGADSRDTQKEGDKIGRINNNT